MIRTQVYLTEDERCGLKALEATTGKKQAELIREAVDRFIELTSRNRRMSILNSAAGMWRDREDVTELYTGRQTWDR